jgi:hypothetical protein
MYFEIIQYTENIFTRVPQLLYFEIEHHNIRTSLYPSPMHTNFMIKTRKPLNHVSQQPNIPIK